MKVLIIEEEIKAALELKSLLKETHKGISLCTILRSRQEVINWFETNNRPDLIFSEISVDGGISFDILKEVSINVPLIYCTANADFAFQAFENNAFDYLLKPISKEKLKRCFNKLKLLQNIGLFDPDYYKKRLQDYLRDHFSEGYKSTLITYFRGNITPLNTSEICFIYTDNKRVLAVTNGKQFELQNTLDQLMKMLNPKEFYRANRQFIIHRKSIAKIETLPTRKQLVRLCQPELQTATISKAKTKGFLKWIDNSF